MTRGPDVGGFEPVNPYVLSDQATEHFWADTVADRIEQRDPAEPIVIKGGISPSGVPHLGNMNELMRGHFVAEVLRERGHDVRQLFTADDRDPLRSLPRTLADADGNLVDLGAVDAGALGRNLGMPYTDIPDPFGEVESYGAHFTRLIERSADQLGVDIEVVSMTELYEDGRMDDIVAEVLSNRGAVRRLLGQYQEKVDEGYVPFNPICQSCGRITETVTDVDLDAGSVGYVCTPMEAGERSIGGCGHEGRAGFREGKLPWRLEWPAQWQVLGVDFEPFGKDHAEGSWPSSDHIAQSLFETEPPVPMVYEWFTLGGEPLSSSAGNVVLAGELLEMLEREVLYHFFAKDPRKARDFDVERLDQLVDEFDRLEAQYFDEVSGTETELARAHRVYPYLVEEIRDQRSRIPYTYAAVLGMTDNPELRERMARRAGHLDADVSNGVRKRALARVPKARRWAANTDNEYNYRLAAGVPALSVEADMSSALEELAAYVEEETPPGAELQEAIYEIARANGVEVSALFTTGYRLFLDTSDGPRLGPFLAALEPGFVVRRLRRVE